MFQSSGPEFDADIIAKAQDALSEHGRWRTSWISFQAIDAIRAWAEEEGVGLNVISWERGVRMYLRKRVTPAVS